MKPYKYVTYLNINDFFFFLEANNFFHYLSNILHLQENPRRVHYFFLFLFSNSFDLT